MSIKTDLIRNLGGYKIKLLQWADNSIRFIKMKVINSLKKKEVINQVKQIVQVVSAIKTDGYNSYNDFKDNFIHK